MQVSAFSIHGRTRRAESWPGCGSGQPLYPPASHWMPAWHPGSSVGKPSSASSRLLEPDNIAGQAKTSRAKPKHCPTVQNFKRQAKTSTDSVKTLRARTKTSPDKAKTSPDSAKTSTDKPKTSRDSPKTLPDKPKTLPDSLETLSDRAKTSRDKAEMSPDNATLLPDKPALPPDNPALQRDKTALLPAEATFQPAKIKIVPDCPAQSATKPTRQADKPLAQSVIPQAQPKDEPRCEGDSPLKSATVSRWRFRLLGLLRQSPRIATGLCCRARGLCSAIRRKVG